MSKQFAAEITSTPFSSSGGSMAVLIVSPNYEDCVSLERIFRFDWTVVASASVSSALSVLREIPLPIVVCDCAITSGTWREMLDRISLLPDPPLFIATSRLADDYLWAEALNLGAFDLLAKPFNVDEVIRIVSSALQHWQDRHGVHSGRTAQRMAVTSTNYHAATGT